MRSLVSKNVTDQGSCVILKREVLKVYMKVEVDRKLAKFQIHLPMLNPMPLPQVDVRFSMGMNIRSYVDGVACITVVCQDVCVWLIIQHDQGDGYIAM